VQLLPRYLITLGLALLVISTARGGQVIELEITGVDGPVLDNVRSHLGIARHAPGTDLLSLPLPGKQPPEKPLGAGEIRRLHRRADREIRQALQPFGYYEPVIDARLEQRGEVWAASYHIDPGAATLIHSVDISVTGEGETDPALQPALSAARLQAGRQLQHSDYTATKESLLKAALAAGYLDARYLAAELRILPADRQARITLRLDTGARYYFGPVSIRQEILDPGFVQRYVHFREGDPFDTDQLLRLQLALGDSGYFSQVEVQIQRDAAVERHIPVIIMTTPVKPRRYAYGLGFGTDTGPRVSLGTEFRRINDRGHSVLADLRASSIARSVGLLYRIPVGNLVSDRLVYKASADFEDVADKGSTDLYTLGINYNIEWGPLQRRLYLNYQYEDFSLGEESNTTQNLIPGVTLSQLRADDVLFPRQGFSWSMDLRGAAGVISDTRFLRAQSSGRYVYPLGRKGRLLARGQLGATTVDDFAKLPATERFFAGGDQSVRGYDYQQLGPTDDSGDVVGGRYLAVGSLELDYLFFGNFGAAVFVDTGNADESFFPSLKTGAGAGLRWRSPVGMLRLDVAHPFDDEDDNYRIHISIGPEL